MKTNFGFFVELIIYIAIMFGVREFYFDSLGFIANGLMWSLSAFAFATWRMRAHSITWADLGLVLPRRHEYKSTLVATAITLACVMATMIAFQILKDQFDFGLTADTSEESATSKFGLKDSYLTFFMIIPFVWLESMLEELLDRAFLITWIERIFSSTMFSTIFAVIAQAFIFGFRHSNDFSERSITVGLIGLVMGVSYIVGGRKLWPIVLAHMILNTGSMWDRV
ncbi:MAG: CPBP family intramembrane metalloprotease [Planctomycetes bacterium]|nr:CPBP family intramembrane metalloprotease [Planctomycetota bacterium]